MNLYLRGAALLFAGALAAPRPAHGDDLLDSLSDRLTLTVPGGKAALHVSGLLDLEAYSLPQPAPGLLDTERHFLFNPRLTTFFDAQLGPLLYAFGQARVDRGFDPGDHGARFGLDEYALRFTPWEDGRINLQAGKFATVVGTWVARHYSWENPFILAPGPYENLTGVQDTAPSRGERHAAGAAEYANRIPIVWGPDYASGIAVTGREGPFNWAVEMKNTALSSRPETWSAEETGFDRPAFNGRLGFQPSPTWSFGFSGSSGSYLRSDLNEPLPSGHDTGDYREWVLGQDATFAWRHTQIWAECFEARFQLPEGGHADSLSYYVEAKYQFAPQLFGALRWNQQFFGPGPEGAEVDSPWGPDLWRIDWALGYRFTTHTQLKLQYSLEHEHSSADGFRQIVAGQFTVRF